MGAIGDLFWMFRGEGKQLHADAQREGAKAGQTIGQHIQAGIKKSWSKGEVGKGLAQGLGLAGALGAAALVTRAISSVINILGDSVQAILTEEKSIAGLDAALKANVQGWDGNREAIEEVLASRMRLGFSDDEQRESLGRLVAVTGDATKALGLQRLAMDLARFKAIDLATASQLVGKVAAGNVSALTRYGIVLRKGATASEALAALQGKLAGQAEAYAKTASGKMLAAQIKLGEVMEKLGAAILPVVVAGMTAIADGVETFAPMVQDFVENTRREFEQLALAGHAVHDFFADLLEPVSDTRDALFKAGEEAQRFRDSAVLATEEVGGAAKGSVKAVDNLAAATNTLGDEADTAAEKASDLADELRDNLVKAVDAATDAMLEAIHGPAQLTGKLAELQQELIEDQAELAKLTAIKTPTAEQRRDILSTKGAIADTRAEIFKTRVDFALLDGTGLDALIIEVGKLANKTDAAGDEALTLLHTLQKVRTVNPLVGNPATRGNARATGGPVWAGGTFRVGETGAEDLHMFPSGGGYVVPVHAQSSGGSSGPNITIYNPEPRAADEDIVRATRRVAAVGL